MYPTLPRRRIKRIRRARVRGALERLEDRRLLAAVVWNTDLDGFWDDPANWFPQQVPGSGDDVTIDRGAASPTVTVRDFRQVKSLVSRESLVVTAQSLQLDGVSQIDGGTLTLDGGNLSAFGATTITANGVLDWKAGNVTGNNLVNLGLITLRGNADRTLFGGIASDGVIRHEDQGRLLINTSAVLTINANGVYDFVGDGGIGRSAIGGGSHPSMVVIGTLKKSGGAGTAAFDGGANGVDLHLSGGTIDVESGRLRINERGIWNGAMLEAAANAVLELSDAPYFSGTITGAGSGRIEITGGNIDSVDLGVSGGHATFDFPAGLAHWVAGSLGSGGCGSFVGCGTTLVNAGFLSVEGEADKSIHGSGLINTGTLALTGTGDVNLVTTFDNRAGGVIDFTIDARITGVNQFGSQVGRIINVGVLRKSAGAGDAIIDPLIDMTGGTIESLAGRLRLTRSGWWQGGQLNASAQAVVEIAGGAAMTGTFTGTGAGRIEFSGGSLSSFNGGVDGAHATLDFPAGLFEWTGGGIGSGGCASVIGCGTTLVNQGQMRIAGDQAKSLFGSGLINEGAIVNAGAGTFGLNGVTFENRAGATYDHGGDGPFSGLDQFGNAGHFINAGTLRKSAGPATVDFTARLHNRSTGVIDVDAGRFRFLRGGSGNGATFELEAGAGVDLAGDHNQPFSFDNGTYAGTGLGTIVFTGQIATPGGAAPVLDFPPDMFFWRGGTTFGRLINDGQITLDAPGDVFSRIYFTNRGTLLHVGAGNYLLNPDSVFENEGLYELRSDADIVVPNSASVGTMQFINTGTLRKSGGVGLSELRLDTTQFNRDLRLNNSGAVEILSGAFTVHRPVIQVSGATLTGGVWHVGPAATLAFAAHGNLTTNRGQIVLDGAASTFTNINSLTSNEGVLSLRGGRDFTTTAGLANSGRLELGPGSVLAIKGALTQTSAGVLETQISSRPRTGLYGRAAVQGTANLAGRLEVTRVDGFGPTSGDEYPILTYAIRAGTFASIDGLTPFFSSDVGATLTKLTVNAGVPTHDLAAGAITTPATARPGVPVTITYEVHNASMDAAAGSWFDSLYLSRDATLDADDRLIGRVERTGGAAGLATYQESLVASLPAAVDGAYQVILVADSRHVVADPDRANNTSVSSAPVQVASEPLVLGQTTSGIVRDGQDIYYRLDVPPAGDILVSTEFLALNQAEVFVRRAAMPTRTAFDATSSNPNELLRELTLASPQAGAYYVLIHGREGAGAGTAYAITPARIGLNLDAVSPARGSNAGSVTATFRGAGFLPSSRFELLDAGGATLRVATQSVYVDGNTMHATFDLTGLAAGVYDLHVVQDTSAGTVRAQLDDAFTVTTGIPGRVEAYVSSPGSIRAGRAASVVVEYRNTGETDVVAPLLMVTADHATLKLPHQANYSGQRLMLLGIPSDGRAGVLPPGAGGQIKLDFLPTASTTFQIYALDDDAAPVDLTAMKDQVRPFGIPAAAWDVVFANFVADAGTTWGQWRRTLADIATHLGELGGSTPDVARLIGFGLARADNFGELTRRHTLGAFGFGWPDRGDTRVILDDDGDPVVRTEGNLRSFLIASTGGGFVPARNGDTGRLAWVVDHFELVESDDTRLVFAPDGKLDFVEDPSGNRVTMTYVGDRLVAQTDSTGATVSYAYDANGRVVSTTDPAGRIARFMYDAAGTRLASVEDDTGTLTYAYVTGQGAAREGALASITTSTGPLFTFTYDTRGRLAQVTRFNQDGPSQYFYDSTGEVVLLDPAGRETRGLYNELGDVARLFEPGGATTIGKPDLVAGSIDQIDTTGARWTTGYDERGNAVLLRNPLGFTIETSYDPVFNRLERFQDQRGNTTLYTYDAQGNRTSIVDAAGRVFEYQYDAAGNPVVATNRRGQAIDFTYDAQHLIVTKEFPDGRRIDYTYDGRFNVTSITVTQGLATDTTTMTYDAKDQLTSVTDPSGRTLTMTHDASGRRTRLAGPDGLEMNYAYDSAGRLARVSDATNATIAAYDYDALGRVVRVDKGGGPFTEYAYDALGQITSIVNRAADGSVASRFDYLYDDRGLVRSASTPEGVNDYEYDALGQLTRVELPAGRVIEYEYDAAGNRIRVVDAGAPTVYGVDNLNQMLGGGSITYSYDADGNLVARDDGGSLTTYQYDAENRLVKVESPTDIWEYEYDVLGNRSAVVRNGARTEYVFDVTGRPIAQYGAGGFEAHFLAGLGLVARRDAGGNDAFYAFDLAGNATELLDPAGAVLNEYRYLPFGEKLSSQVTVDNPFTFVGQHGVMDSGDELYFMRNRYYSPETGRFVSRDPSGVEGLDANLYRYAANNPLAQIDPAGLSTFLAELARAAGEIAEGTAVELQQSISATSRYVDDVRRAGALADPFHERLAKYGLESVERQITRVKWFASQDIPADVANRIREMLGKAEAFLEKGRPVLERIRESEAAVARLTARAAAEKAAQEAAEQAARGTAVRTATREVTETTVQVGVKKLGARALLGRLILNPYLGAAMLGWDLGSLARLIPGVDETAYRAASAIVNATTSDENPFANFGPRAWELFASGWTPRGRSFSDLVNSFDPNDIVGPAGVGTQQFVASQAPLAYTIYFENLATATAPAQEVSVTLPLDPDLDWSTVEVGDIRFGDVVIQVPPGRGSLATRTLVPASASIGGEDLVVEITVDVDPTTGNVTWKFRSLAPDTGDFPENPFGGFLPPNTLPPIGEGAVEFTVRPRTTAPSGTQIDARAVIVFDTEAPIATRSIFHTLDVLAPTATIAGLPDAIYDLSPSIQWSAEDEPNGSGLGTVDLYVATDGGPFRLWVAGETGNARPLDLPRGHTYSLFAVANDRVGHVEGLPEQAEAETFYLGPPWHNPRDPLDVDDDGFVVSLDALIIVNLLNDPTLQGPDGALPLPPPTPTFQTPFYDVDGDNFVVSLDAVLVINHLNAPGSPEGSGEANETEIENARPAPVRPTMELDLRYVDWALRAWASDLDAYRKFDDVCGPDRRDSPASPQDAWLAACSVDTDLHPIVPDEFDDLERTYREQSDPEFGGSSSPSLTEPVGQARRD